MSSGYKVSEVMNKKVFDIDPTDSVEDAAKRMRDNDAGSVIVTEDGNTVGILTDTDIVNKVVASNIDASEINVEDVMSSPVVVGRPDEDITDIGQRMEKNRIKRIPIVEDGEAVGMITSRDLTDVYPDIIDFLSRQRGREESPVQVEESSTTGRCDLCENFTTDLRVQPEGDWACEECRVGSDLT